ncbi:MAG TPA: M42 family metallopeptidase [Spirochaetales bacterium]|nr:M42 family metallopeptidase [Spirochaetales bacterium]HRY54456.1 M42 family metallopeptidase [Spirochaetia bacterium]HRZ63759.1 M42 family metallopeptidase [Spirochaetia bacterium]
MIPDKEQLRLFETLTQIPGVAAHEMAVRDFMKAELSKHADELVYDNLGSVFAVKRCGVKGAPRLMMSGHMDEVGFLVKQITPKGLIRIFPVGRTWEHVIMAQRVKVYSGQTGLAYPGAVASIPPHLLPEDSAKRLLSVDQMLVDIGTESREEVLSLGIRPGDMIVVDGPFVPLLGGKKLLAKAWDNRFGCALAVDVLREVAADRLAVDLYIGATVQEESGLRGARTSAFAIEPDVAIVFESSAANDNQGDELEFGQQGKGALMRFIDRTSITHRGLFRYAVGLCEERKIPHQYFMALGGTDSGEIHTARSGCPSMTVGVPSRYIHTNSSIMDYSDYAAAKDFALAFVRSLDAAAYRDRILSYSR